MWVSRIKDSILDKIIKINSGGVMLLGLLAIFQTSVIGMFYVKQYHVADPMPTAIASVILYLLSLGMLIALVILVEQIKLKSIRIALEAMIALAWGTVWLVDCFLLYQYQDFLDTSKIVIVLMTAPASILTYIKIYICSPPVVLSLVAAVMLLMAACCLFSRISMKRRAAKALSAWMCLSIIFTLAIGIVKSYEESALGIKALPRKLFDAMYWYYPVVRVENDLQCAISSMGSISEAMESLEQKKSDEEILALDRDVPYVVFVLGESTDRNHMGLYGYGLPTSPLLEKRAHKGELAVFDDAISCANDTASAMKLIFNTAAKGYDGKWFAYQDIIDVLSKAGYYTTWLSNQEPVGALGSMDKIWAMRSDAAYFMHESGGLGGANIREHDGVLLPVLDKMLSEHTANKQFYTIHLLGTHETYSERYPEEFAKFSPTDEEGTPQQCSDKAEYDNAVLYDDYIVDSIISRFEDKNAVVFFISDHGMDLYDTGDTAGHTGENKGSRHMIEVPFVIWGSQEFRQKNPVLWQQILHSVHRPYRTDYIMHTILDVAGIRSTSYEPSNSVVNDAFVAKDRIYNGQVYKK